jgi:hypothetical protein
MASAVKEILSIFGESVSVWGIASWFAGANTAIPAADIINLLHA